MTETTQLQTLDEVEAAHIRRVLEACQHNRRRAAVVLGIARSTLLAKIVKYQLATLARYGGRVRTTGSATAQ